MIQLEMIEKVQLWAQKNDAISAVFMYGSFVKDEGDIYSDIEFYVFLNPDIEFDRYRWVNSIEHVHTFFINEFGSEVAIFRNLIRGEFHFLPVSEVSILKSWVGLISFEYFEKMSLVDKDGKLSAILINLDKDSPNRSSLESFKWICNSAINSLLHTRNLLLRGELAHAHHSLFYVHKYILWLIRIEVDSTKHWESPAKKAEEDLPAYWYKKYTHCTANLEKRSLIDAYQQCFMLTLELFNKLQAPTDLVSLLDEIRAEM
ncbi:aminoglycoside 6-adenylyltransferase [Sphingobacterium sp. JB170]|uniref:aminoglycoside 6-adenylyltransferase n=1 Tax=Sphingobacterium sp. JB170 TaxID=1434842 RepID=UPI00097F3C90|nr:aminoglycoside 6-adenylyltransferase [Sphingobacterium sp. JB170]SJN41146.1 hypothetical protein FM107_10900 [Sphingobacterium sp. JB170]